MEQYQTLTLNKTNSENIDGGNGDESGSQSSMASSYKFLGLIGAGAFGVVRYAQNKKTGDLVAIKTYRPRNEDGISSNAVREISLLKELHHPNIVSIYGVHIHDFELAMVLEYYDVDLAKYMTLTGREGLTLNHIKSFLHQLLSGLEYCHGHRIIHRDLKPRNVLIKRDGKLCITDFGLSKSFTVPFRNGSPKVGTLCYRAPELLLGQDYTIAIDLWSVGCIFAEMMLLTPLFKSQRSIGQILSIFNIMGTPDESTWPGITNLSYYSSEYPQWKKMDLKHFINQRSQGLEMNEHGINLLDSLLKYSPNERITAKKALEHSYFYDTYAMLIV